MEAGHETPLAPDPEKTQMTQEKTSTLKNIAVAGALALSLGGNAYLLHEVRGLQSDLGGFVRT
ncbi:MAG: hypothetical protein R2748_34830 [Bryobacterales bacterium]